MVQKLISAFRAKHKFNLSNERLQKQAEKWASKVEDENAIESFIDGLDIEPLEEIARLDDALRAKPQPKPIEDEPKTENDYQKQIDELKELLEAKSKSDLATSRSSELKSLPDELKATLKFVQLENLSDDDFASLKTELTTQAQSIEVAKSKANPRFGGAKLEGGLSAEKAKEIANRI